MMKMKVFTFPSFVLVLVAAACIFETTEALKCFQCVHDDSMNRTQNEDHDFYGIRGHRSCKKGELPDEEEDLDMTCPKKGAGMDGPVCMLLRMTKLPARNGTAGNFNVTARGCFYTNPAVEQFIMQIDTDQRTLQNLSIISAWTWKGVFDAALNDESGRFSTDTDVVFHYCRRDHCNPAPTLMSSGGIMIYSILISLVILFH